MPDLQADFMAVGIHVLGAAACDNLVRQAGGLAPDAVVCWDAHPTEHLLPALAMLQATMPVPVIVFTSDGQAESVVPALDAGVHAWVVNGYAPHRLRAVLQLAI